MALHIIASSLSSIIVYQIVLREYVLDVRVWGRPPNGFHRFSIDMVLGGAFVCVNLNICGMPAHLAMMFPSGFRIDHYQSWVPSVAWWHRCEIYASPSNRYPNSNTLMPKKIRVCFFALCLSPSFSRYINKGGFYLSTALSLFSQLGKSRFPILVIKISINAKN